MIRKNMHLLAISMLMVTMICAAGPKDWYFSPYDTDTVKHYSYSRDMQKLASQMASRGNPIDLFIAEAEKAQDKRAQEWATYRMKFFVRTGKKTAFEKELIKAVDRATDVLTVCKKWKLDPNDCEAGFDCCYLIKQLRAAQAQAEEKN